MALAEKMPAGNMRMCPRTMAKELVEGTVAHSKEIWAMLTTEWEMSAFPKKRMRRCASLCEILVLQKTTIDPHFVP